MNYQWDWALLLRDPYLGWLLDGVKWTAAISMTAFGLALMLGIGVGILRTVDSHRLRAIGGTYVQLFRSVPLLVQLFLWYYVVPEILPDGVGFWLKRELPLPEFWTTSVGLGLFMSARIAEQTRAALNAAGRGLRQAALSQGFAPAQIYRYLLVPVAFRYALPPFTSELLNTVKNSSLALTIGMLELTGQSRQIEAYTFHGIEAFTAATLIYMALSLLAIAASRRLEKTFQIPGMLAERP